MPSHGCTILRAAQRRIQKAVTARWPTWLPGRPNSPLRIFSVDGFEELPADEPLEEENWDFYSPELFYPVSIGEVFKSRYQVVGKFGYGAHSTVWMARDLEDHQYVAIKVCESDSVTAKRELAAYEEIGRWQTDHPGKGLLRKLLDHFEIPGRGPDPHLCLVHEPLSFSIDTIRCILPHKRLELPFARAVLTRMLHVLDFLHRGPGIVHGDLQASNMHIRVPASDSSFVGFENSGFTDPTPRKTYPDRVIYESQALGMPETNGYAILCDLGEARLGFETYTGWIQPEPYRAPEVECGIPWTFSADIWNFAMVAWTLVEGDLLFSGDDNEEARKRHIAEIAVMLGPPPKSFLERCGEEWEKWFSGGMTLAGEGKEVMRTTLEERETRFEGDDKAGFLAFMRKMLCWMPEERASAQELLQDAWLKGRESRTSAAEESATEVGEGATEADEETHEHAGCIT